MSRKGENIRKRKDGRWEARIKVNGTNGEIYQKSIYAKSYQEVKARKIDFLSTLNRTEDLNKKKTIPFRTLAESWLASKENIVKESTYAKYKQMLDTHILKMIGDVHIDKINKSILDEFMDDQLRCGNTYKQCGLSTKTVSDMMIVINQILKYGKNQGYSISTNSNITYPKQKKKKIRIFSIHQQQILEEYLFSNTNSFTLGIIISLFTGIRIGEICGLKWKDIDLDNDVITVSHTILRIPNNDKTSDKKTKIIINTPKSEAGYRDIPIPSFLSDFLKTFIKTHENVDDDHYILTGNTVYMEPRAYYYHYKTILKKCNLTEFSYHSLRHTFATRCIENGFDIKSLSEILGHADVTTTYRLYVHPTFNMKKKQMDRLVPLTIDGQNMGQEK